MHFFAFCTFAQRLLRQFVRSEFKGQSTFVRDPGKHDAHDIGDSEAHGFEDGSCLFLDLGLDSGSDYCVLGHNNIVAQTGYRGTHRGSGAQSDRGSVAEVRRAYFLLLKRSPVAAFTRAI